MIKILSEYAQKMWPVVLVISIVLCLPSIAMADTDTPQTVQTEITQDISYQKQASTLMEKGNFREAYDLLKKYYPYNREDIETNFLLGVSAYEISRPEESIGYFEFILEKYPDLTRVKLELGRAYAACGRIKEARREFEAVRATNPPKVVGENINRFLAMLDSRKDWQFRVNLGYLYDSNVNVGPTTDTVNLFGVPWILNDSSKQQSDIALTAAVVIDHIKQNNSSNFWQSNLTFRHIGYSKYHEFTSDQLFLSTGPMNVSKKRVISVPIIFNYTALGSNDYSTSYGLMPQIQYALTPKQTLIFSISGEKKTYNTAPDRTGSYWTGNLASRHSLNASDFIQLSYRRTQENTRVSYLDNYADILSIGYYKMFSNGWTLFVEPGVCWNRYRDKEAAYDQSRSDNQFVINVNLAKNIGKWQYALGFTHTKNDSNLDMHNYYRNQITLQTSRIF